jgi:amino acid permease
MNMLSVILGVLATLVGLGILVTAIRNRGDGEDPRSNIMLIAGMMITAFGLLIAGFAVGYATSEPLDADAATGSAGLAGGPIA